MRADLDAVGAPLDAAARDETWTKARLARERGVVVTPQCPSVLLCMDRFRWKHTARLVRHLQKDPALQDAARAHLESLIL